jgi:hypothetical protein
VGGHGGRALGYGGIAAVARAMGLSPATISRGLLELDVEAVPADRVRKAGGGRKRATTHHPTLLRDLEALVEPTAPGDPESPLRWTCLSTRTLAVALEALGYSVSHTVVAELLHGLGYSLQGNIKTREGRQHPDRDAQFRYIARHVRAAQRRQQPTISVDTKKKELVGPFKNGGRAWRPAKTPQRVRVHDFVIPGPTGGKAIPYGVYDLHRNEGWVSVGVDHDTATFGCDRFGAGGSTWAGRSIGTPRRCSSRRTPGGATARGSDCGSLSCSNSRTGPGWPSRSATSRQGRASGTRSSIACSPTSP